MSKTSQIKFNARCLARQIAQGHFSKAKFHLNGILRAMGIIQDAR